MSIKKEFYTELNLMNIAKHHDDEEAMEMLVRPHVTQRVEWGDMILVTSKETGATIGFDIVRRNIDKEMEFTDAIQLRANEIAARHVGCWDSDFINLREELRQIGIEIPDIIDGYNKYAITYKGNPVLWCSFIFNEYYIGDDIKYSCYFG